MWRGEGRKLGTRGRAAVRITTGTPQTGGVRGDEERVGKSPARTKRLGAPCRRVSPAHLYPIQVLKRAAFRPYFVPTADQISAPGGVRQVLLEFLLARYFSLKMHAQTGALTHHSIRQVLVRPTVTIEVSVLRAKCSAPGAAASVAPGVSAAPPRSSALPSDDQVEPITGLSRAASDWDMGQPPTQANRWPEAS
jgi:hypothetical protein